MGVQAYPQDVGTPTTLGYTQLGSDVTGLGTGINVTGYAQTVTVAANRRLKISAHFEFGYSDTTTAYMFHIYEDGVDVGRIAMTPRIPNGGEYFVVDGSVVRTPTPGVHTYTLYASRYIGSGTLSVYSSGTINSYMLVEDITGGVGAPSSVSNGVLIVTSGTRPIAVEGMVIYETDTDKLVTNIGSGWQDTVPLGAWSTYTPTWTSDGTATAVGNGTLAGRYTRIGRLIIGNIFLGIGSTSTIGTGNYFFALPFMPYTSQSPWAVVGSGKMYQNGSSSTALSRIYNGTQRLHLIWNSAYNAGTETLLGAAQPWTWNPALGGSLDIQFMYEAAS